MMNVYKYTHLDEIDGVYQGGINKSFRKEGFGIYIDQSFNMYFGFWRNNTMHGLGLIVFRSGQIMYTEFARNLPGKLRVVRLPDRIIVGVFSGGQVHGIGFQFSFQEQKWRMNRYNKGDIAQKMSQQPDSTLMQPPQMMAIDQSVYRLYKSYLDKDLFKKSGDQFYSQNQDYEMFGLLQDNKQQGLGVTMERCKLIQAGQFKNGLLEGLCFKTVQQGYECGFYRENNKHGYVEICKSGDQRLCLYNDGMQMKQVKDQKGDYLKQIIKRSKEESPNYLSVRSQLNLHNLEMQPQVLQYSKLESTLRNTLRPLSQRKRSIIRTLSYKDNKDEARVPPVAQLDNSSLEFVRRNFTNLSITGKVAYPSVDDQLSHEESIAVEQNPLVL